MSSALIVRISSSGCRASVTTNAVISLVIEAIGSTAWLFLLNSTSLVSWSSTSATLDFRSSSSPPACNPESWPNDSLRGMACSLARGRVDLMPGFFLKTTDFGDPRDLACDSTGVAIRTAIRQAVSNQGRNCNAARMGGGGRPVDDVFSGCPESRGKKKTTQYINLRGFPQVKVRVAPDS